MEKTKEEEEELISMFGKEELLSTQAFTEEKPKNAQGALDDESFHHQRDETKNRKDTNRKPPLCDQDSNDLNEPSVDHQDDNPSRNQQPTRSESPTKDKKKVKSLEKDLFQANSDLSALNAATATLLEAKIKKETTIFLTGSAGDTFRLIWDPQSNNSLYWERKDDMHTNKWIWLITLQITEGKGRKRFYKATKPTHGDKTISSSDNDIIKQWMEDVLRPYLWSTKEKRFSHTITVTFIEGLAYVWLNYSRFQDSSQRLIPKLDLRSKTPQISATFIESISAVKKFVSSASQCWQ